MNRMPKILLALSVVTFLVALTDLGISIGYGLLKPMSVIFFMLFFIMNLLAKEMALYDEEQRRRLELARSQSESIATRKDKSSSANRPGAGLTAAHSH